MIEAMNHKKASLTSQAELLDEKKFCRFRVYVLDMPQSEKKVFYRNKT